MAFRKVLLRLPRVVEDNGRRIVLNNLERYYVTENKDFHYNGGVAKKEQLEKGGFFTSEKDSIVVFDATFSDEFSNLKRKAQVITHKDIGPIITYTGINKESIILDAGTGSGHLCGFLGKIAKRVDSFDIEEAHLEMARKNIKILALDNVTISTKNIYDSTNFEENTYDVFTLDVPEPWNALATASKTLKVGGFLVIYAPNINQIHQTIISLTDDLLHEQTIEVIEREWSVKEKVLRPVTKDFGHTAFLSFVRKIKN
ncbi:MAG: methyltransferase domain-containing protein [Candidatus Woesearchaeota archaeon]|jgi:tRNA (adenine57-N1/adenine58-N1)-methyltransferase